MDQHSVKKRSKHARAKDTYVAGLDYVSAVTVAGFLGGVSVGLLERVEEGVLWAVVDHMDLDTQKVET